jgi:hypothetical protein
MVKDAEGKSIYLLQPDFADMNTQGTSFTNMNFIINVLIQCCSMLEGLKTAVMGIFAYYAICKT